MPDKQQPFGQRTTARILWLWKVAGPGLEGVQEAFPAPSCEPRKTGTIVTFISKKGAYGGKCTSSALPRRTPRNPLEAKLREYGAAPARWAPPPRERA